MVCCYGYDQKKAIETQDVRVQSFGSNAHKDTCAMSRYGDYSDYSDYDDHSVREDSGVERQKRVLGYMPTAATPQINDVKSRIDNKNQAYKKKKKKKKKKEPNPDLDDYESSVNSRNPIYDEYGEQS